METLERIVAHRRALVVVLGLTAAYGVSLVMLDRRGPLDVPAQKAALRHAGEYLERHLDPNGRFDYLVRLDNKPVTNQYNVLRHAGTIYGLALYHELNPDPRTRQTILRASQYLLQKHVRQVPDHPDLRAILSYPGEEVEGTNGLFKLGGAGLGLIALVKAQQLDTNSVSTEVLRSLGKFLLFMQLPNGRFRSRYEANGRFNEEEVMFYSGEAMLALALLYKSDPDPRWLDATLNGIQFVEQSRAKTAIRKLPSDHWLMITTAALWPEFSAAKNPPISRERMLAHSLNLGRMMMHGQWWSGWWPGLRGSLVSDSGIASSSTRLEALGALYSILPPDHPDRTRIRSAIENGVRFILRAQIQDGKERGGFRGVLWKSPLQDREYNLARDEIRIDYVQHAMSAIVGYLQLVATDPSVP